MFLNDLFLFIKKTSFHNYADDNTLSATDIDDLIEILTDESQETIDWLKLNQMIVNPKKFQAMFISKKKNALPRNTKQNTTTLWWKKQWTYTNQTNVKTPH